MAIAHQFDYVRPATLAEATRLRVRLGAKSRILAGGTDLITLIEDNVAKPTILIDIKDIEDLKGIEFSNGTLSIGSLATFSDLLESAVVRKQFPIIREMAGWVASNGIRNRATMAGNICSAVPCCDSGPILLLYDAVVHVTGRGGKKKIPIADWFVGPRRTILKDTELVAGLSLSLPKKKHAGCFVKLRRYKGEDLAQASVSILALADKTWRVAFGSVTPVPIRSQRIERALNGESLTDDLIRRAVELVPQEITPITDIRATKEYRLMMCQVMLERGLKSAEARLKGTGPAYGEEII